jgi:cation:H+ antiporter
MFSILIAIIALPLLFIILGRSANILIDNLQYIAKMAKISPLLLGAILGLFTTIPELALGISAIANDISQVALGNIWGGVIVLFTLILGTAIVFNQKIKTDGKLNLVLPSFIYIILSIILAYSGTLNFYSGLVLVVLYFVLIYIKFSHGRPSPKDEDFSPDDIETKLTFRQKIIGKIKHWHYNYKKEIKLCSLALIVMLVSSHLIVDQAELLLGYFKVSPFIVGLLLFSVGTNLPELSITIRSAFKKAGELSFGYLVGAATNSIFLLGVLALFHTFTVPVNLSFIILSIVVFLVLTIVLIFYLSQKSFDKWEGYTLLGIYFAFIIYQVFIGL